MGGRSSVNISSEKAETKREELELEREYNPRVHLYVSYWLLSGDIECVEVGKNEWSQQHKAVLILLGKTAENMGIFAYNDCSNEHELQFAFSTRGNHAYTCADILVENLVNAGFQASIEETSDEVIVYGDPHMAIRFYKHAYSSVGQTLASMDNQRDWCAVLSDGKALEIGGRLDSPLWRGGKPPTKIVYDLPVGCNALNIPRSSLARNVQISLGRETSIKHVLNKYHTPECIPALDPYTLRGPSVPVEYKKLWMIIYKWRSYLPWDVLSYMCMSVIRTWVEQALNDDKEARLRRLLLADIEDVGRELDSLEEMLDRM